MLRKQILRADNIPGKNSLKEKNRIYRVETLHITLYSIFQSVRNKFQEIHLLLAPD